MYLVDTDVISEIRKGEKANDGVRKFFEGAGRDATKAYADSILPFDEETAHVWGRLRVPNPKNPLDKQIAATALIHNLTVVTRNTEHFAPTGVKLKNPFADQ